MNVASRLVFQMNMMYEIGSTSSRAAHCKHYKAVGHFHDYRYSFKLFHLH
jgi:hypothetical protein